MVENLLSNFNRYRSWTVALNILDNFPVVLQFKSGNERIKYPLKSISIWLIEQEICELIRVHWGPLKG